MSDRIRPAASGNDGRAAAFLRSMAQPTAAMVLGADILMPTDWPLCAGGAEDNVGHALGWTLEVQRDALVLLNPLGEGIVKTPLPELSWGWLRHVRESGSCAVFLAPAASDLDDVRSVIDSISAAGSGRAATVRSAVADDYGKAEAVGRNAPCPCGSGKKHKHCCLT